MIKFVSSNGFAAKSVEQMRVEQSQFEQFTPTLFHSGGFVSSVTSNFCSKQG
jgi:hypothetical protein